jgi:hypothetical protein
MVETNITDLVDIKINETVFSNVRLRILLLYLNEQEAG